MMDRFATVITCMDGRIQRRISDHLQDTFGVSHLDTITTAGAVRHLAEETDRTASLLADLEVSTSVHRSTQIGVVAHHDCAGNPVADDVQRSQITQAVRRLSDGDPEIEVIGLFLTADSEIELVEP